MTQKVYEGRGFPKRVVRRAVRAVLNYYMISNSFVHGSQGILWDLFEEPERQQTPWILHFRSFRLTQRQVIGETVGFLVQALGAEGVHRKRDLHADMFTRELNLITGFWETGPLGAINPYELR